MRRWEKNFEKTHKRKPTAAAIEASEEMQGLQAQLRGDSPQPQSRSDSPQPPLQRVDSGGQQQQQQQTPQQQTAVANESGTPDANWIRGNDYHEILRRARAGQASVNGLRARRKARRTRPPRALPHGIWIVTVSYRRRNLLRCCSRSLRVRSKERSTTRH